MRRSIPMTLLRRAILVTLSCAGACSNGLPAASFIDKLRVLAVAAEPPELAPGETSALSLLAVEPPVPMADGGAPRPITAAWLACALAGGTPSLQSCATQSTLIGTELTASYSASADALGGVASVEVLITVAVADDDAGALACLAELANDGGRPSNPDHCVVSLKRITISDPAQRAGGAVNHNPALADFVTTTPSGFAETLDGGGVWQYAPGPDKAAWDLIAHRAPDAAELKPDGTYEALSVSWFTTAGHLDASRSLYLPPGCATRAPCAGDPPEDGADTTWFAPTQSEAADVGGGDGRVDFWAVVRDDRGGVGWRAGSLTRTP